MVPRRISGKADYDAVHGRELGPVKLLDPLGHGGMGQVFLAEDTTLERKVALKFLPEKNLGN